MPPEREDEGEVRTVHQTVVVEVRIRQDGNDHDLVRVIDGTVDVRLGAIEDVLTEDQREAPSRDLKPRGVDRFPCIGLLPPPLRC